jgi:hypothetical protein
VILRLLFTLTAGALGGLFLTNWITGNSFGQVPWYWFPILLIPAIVLGALAWVRRSATPSPDVLLEALAEGRGALARVISVEQRVGENGSTGSISDCEIVVMPDDVDPYRTRVALLSLHHGPPDEGEIIVVARKSLDRPDVWWVREPGQEWRRRADDAQGDGRTERFAPETAPVWKAPVRPKFRQLAGYGVVAVLGASLIAAPHAEEIGVGLQGIAEGQDLNDMTSGTRHLEAVTALAEAAGTTWFAELHFYQDGRVLADMVIPGQSPAQSWEWNRGEVDEGWIDPTDHGWEQLEEESFDIVEVDWDGIPDLRTKGLELLGLGEADETWLSVERHHMPVDVGKPPVLIQFTFDIGERIWFTTDGEVFE